MAWTTPRTWVAGEIATAANLNTHVRDNMNWCITDAPAASVYHDANQTLTNNVNYTLAFNSEYVDNCAAHSTSVNNSRITVPSGGGGKYLLGASVSVVANATGVRVTRIQMDGVFLLAAVSQVASSAVPHDVPVTTLAPMVAGDYIETQVFQNSGGGLAASYYSNWSPTFWFTWIRS